MLEEWGGSDRAYAPSYLTWDGSRAKGFEDALVYFEGLAARTPQITTG